MTTATTMPEASEPEVEDEAASFDEGDGDDEAVEEAEAA